MDLTGLSRLMQPENWTFLDFSRRTDALAAKLSMDLGQLPEVLGFSRASLFAYRAGKAKITAKAWERLALAETESGIATSPVEKFSETNPENAEEFDHMNDPFAILIRTAMGTIGFDYDCEQTIKKIVMESEETFRVRALALREMAIKVCSESGDLVEALIASGTCEDVVKQAIDLAKSNAALADDVIKAMDQSEALRNLAEKSRDVLRILRKPNASEQ